MFHIKRILLSFLCLVGMTSIAQQGFTSLSIYGGYGSVIQHSSKIGNLIAERPFFVELNLFRPSSGYYKWHRINHFPDYGLCLNYETLGNKEKIGSSIAVAPYLEFPFTYKEKPILFKLKMAWGLAYITKPYDTETNHKNIAIGTHLNTFIQFRFLWQMRISPHLYLNPNITFIHVSNCRVAVPNLGINTLYPSIGITYKWKETQRYSVVQDSTSDKKTKHELLFFTGIGVNEVEPPTGNKLWALTVGANYYFNIHQNQQLGAGIDAFYEQSLSYELRKSDTDAVHFDFYSTFSTGLKLSYAYNFGRLTPILEMGYYLYTPSQEFPNGRLYHRLGCRYYFKNNVVAHFSLKTHFAVAYHIEAGIGYRIGLK